jgi:hypothetical protein
MAYWETADEKPSAPEHELEFARIWKGMPKIVFSKTLEKVEGNARLVREGVAEEVAKLKEQPGKDLAVGGAGLASTFVKLASSTSTGCSSVRSYSAGARLTSRPWTRGSTWSWSRRRRLALASYTFATDVRKTACRAHPRVRS